MYSLFHQVNTVLLREKTRNCWLWFHRPVEVLSTRRVEEVLPALRAVEKALARRNTFAAGFLAYEAGPGLDPALHTHPAGDFPLVWFGLYDSPEILSPAAFFAALSAAAGSYQVSPTWAPSVTRRTYGAAIQSIKDHIATGNTYQVNYTYRLSSPFEGDPLACFAALARAQKAPYAAYVHTGRYALLSASPELFFSLDERRIASRPMKGTAARGLTLQEDEAQADWLRHSEKNRAENVMIVDMVRNDIGRIARTGSVQVPELFRVEKYPTVWQMVSTVTGETTAGLADLLQALFPAASITGAPKPSTMKIIAGLESTPRNVYTGCIGYFGPERKAQFNVAIRTALVDLAHQRAEYGVGGGIVWDSADAAEFEESLTKAKILSVQTPPFSLLESLLWTQAEGYFLLEAHLARLAGSAMYFDIPLDQAEVRRRLEERARSFDAAPRKVRLLVDEAGRITIEATAIPAPQEPQKLRVCLAPQPVSAADPFLYHKTTHRQVYDRARAACPGDWDDVILWNEKGELTEACTANLVVELEGRLLTPPVACGLLAGTYRGWLLDQGNLQEQVIRVEDLARCDKVYLVNSVRKMRQAEVILNPCGHLCAGRGEAPDGQQP